MWTSRLSLNSSRVYQKERNMTTPTTLESLLLQPSSFSASSSLPMPSMPVNSTNTCDSNTLVIDLSSDDVTLPSSSSSTSFEQQQEQQQQHQQQPSTVSSNATALRNVTSTYFSNLLVKAANTTKEAVNTDYFAAKHREYVASAETQFLRKCSEFLSNKRRWEEIAHMDRDVKRRKAELDQMTQVIEKLEDERAIKQEVYERAAKRVATHIEAMIQSVRAEEDGGLLALANSTRECVICRETKRETSFVWNIVCSHSTCFVCLQKSRASGVRTCMVCRAKQPSSSFIILCESQGCRFIAAPM